MPAKSLKPPYYKVTAQCPRDGIVYAERRPHPKAGQRSEGGGIIKPEPQEIKCPLCPFHAKVTSAVLVEVA